MNKFRPSLAAALLAAAAHAQVTVDKPWVRTTVAQQTTTAAYLTITSAQGGKLVEASSPIAASVEVHEMKMDGDLMKMRPSTRCRCPRASRSSSRPAAIT